MDSGILSRKAAGLAAASAQLDKRFGTGVQPLSNSERQALITNTAKAHLTDRDVERSRDFTAQNAINRSYFGGAAA